MNFESSPSLLDEIEEITGSIPASTSLTTNSQSELERLFDQLELSICNKANKKIMRQALLNALNASVNEDEELSKATKERLCDSYQSALKLIDQLKSRHPVPDIYAEADGEFAFDWIHSKRHYLSVSVGPNGSLSYAIILNETRASGKDVVDEILSSQIAFHLDRYTKAILQKR